MNSSQFMDKQVTGLSGSQSDADFFDNLTDEDAEQLTRNSSRNTETNDEILRSYDFQPIRSVGAFHSINLDGSSNAGSGTRVSNFSDSITNSSNLRTYGSLDKAEIAKIIREKDLTAYNLAMVSEIDQAMMKHADKMLHVLEGLDGRLSEMESRTRHLESSVDNLKMSVANNHGKTAGKLRQLENILREVQTGIQVLRDKQDIQEAQFQLAKVQVSKGDQQSENQNSIAQKDYALTGSTLQPSHQSLSASVDAPLSSQHFAPLPLSNISHPSFQQIQALVQPPMQLPQNQMPSLPPGELYRDQLPESTHMQYQLPPPQQPQVPSPAPPQQFQSVPQLSQYPQTPQQQPPTVPVHPSQPQPPSSYRPEESPYLPPQNYVPTVHQSPSMTQSASLPPPSQQYFNAPHHMYEPSPGRTDSGFSSGYGPPLGHNFTDSYPHSGPHSHYGISAMKPPQLSSGSFGPSGGSSYQHLPTAQVLPRSLPTSSSDGGGTSSGSENKVPIDDVVEKVAMMGFSRDQVRAAVGKLKENGQAVDLNVVLDKLMNGGEMQPQKGWFGR